MIPPVAQRYYLEQRALAAPALRAVVSLWGYRVPAGDWDTAVAQRTALMGAVITRAQQPIVEHSMAYAAATLDRAPDVDPDPSGLIGVAGDGRPLASLMMGAAAAARARAAEPAVQLLGAHTAGAIGWDAGRVALIKYAQTALADTGRVAAGLGTVARPNAGYVRVLTGSSCARCVVLAGRVYRGVDPFDRHPQCDCRHLPRDTNDAADWKLDVRGYFDSLTPEAQDKRFTVAGAQAIRDGADPAQVINARRGAGLSFASGRITKAEAAAIRRSRGGRKGRAGIVTNEGMTRRGLANKHMRRPGRRTPQRLMPEAIYQAAGGDRAMALDLLATYGYVLAP